jgi:NADPH:quinone reductase-like Zn-dependent oxidoreductase
LTLNPGVGDRVCGAFFPDWAAGAVSADAVERALGGSVDGMLAENVVLGETGAIAPSDHMTLEEAATLPCAALTAWNAVSEIAKVRPGQTVLLLGTGGVSLFALQFAQLHGARAILASSSDDKMALAKTLGADEVINYRETPEWDKRALELTGGRGVDLVVEVGGANTLERSIRSTRVGGVVAVIGFVAGGGQINPSLLVSRVVRLQGVYVGSLEMFAAMNGAIAQAKLRPVVDRTFPFEEAQQAYRRLESGAHFGKVVVSV